MLRLVRHSNLSLSPLLCLTPVHQNKRSQGRRCGCRDCWQPDISKLGRFQTFLSLSTTRCQCWAALRARCIRVPLPLPSSTTSCDGRLHGFHSFCRILSVLESTKVQPRVVDLGSRNGSLFPLVTVAKGEARTPARRIFSSLNFPSEAPFSYEVSSLMGRGRCLARSL